MRKDKIEEIYPLSPLQEGMLFHVNFEQRLGVYVESLSFNIRGNLDVPALKDAWCKVIERHTSLRTFFVWKNLEKPLQVVRKQVNLPWQELDWRQLSDNDKNEKLTTLLENEHDNGFDLSKAPLLRFKLIRLSDDTYQFIWLYHHIVLDGWSLGVLLDEVFAFYRSEERNSDSFRDQPRPYKDYVSFLAQQDMTDAKMYWKDKLRGSSVGSALGVNRFRSDGDRSSEGYRSQHLELSQVTSAALLSLAREHKLTLSTLFQGAWSLLLNRYTGNEDIIFGAAVSGRSISLSGIESMVGLFIGSLPVRVKISPQSSLISWLTELHYEQVQARQFEYSALQDIQAWSGIDRSKGQSLFNTILSVNNYDFDVILNRQKGDIEIFNVTFREGSHYPLTMLIDPGDRIRIRINYDTGWFDDAAILRILNHLQILLGDMVVNPHKSLSEYSLLTQAEKQTLLFEFNSTEKGRLMVAGISQLFEENVRMNPDSIALRFGDRLFTYRQLNAQANQLAHHLKELGVGPEKIVALFLDRSPLTIVAILGTLKAGGGYLPIDPALPSKRVELMVEETDAVVVLTTQKLAEKLPRSVGRVFKLDADWQTINKKPKDNLSLAVESENVAYIIYTSGSTGKPKGTVIRQRNLLNYVLWARDYYLLGDKLDFPLFSSLSFDLTVTSIFVPLVSGGSIVIYGESATPNLVVLDVVRDDLVDIIKLTPAHLNLILAAGLKANRLRKMIVGGEDLKRNLAQSIHDLFDGRVDIYNEYGPTEATVGCMIHRFDPGTDKDASVPIGVPIDNTQIYIFDANLQPVPPGVVGEICIGGAGVARSYLNRTELTDTRFVENPMNPGSRLYRTGDLARWTSEGQMQFLGRSDHQVKYKGYRIELGEIESNLLEHTEVEAAVVTVHQPEAARADEVSRRCTVCGLPDNYPGASFDASGVCNSCQEFSTLQERFSDYFKTPEDLLGLLDHAKKTKKGKYDCMVLYSGGKDSSYMLYQLVKEYGMQPLVFSLDNGYISEEAKANIRRVTDALGVDLVFGRTPHMNAVFVDSLNRHSNVCDGCFKVIYTLSIKLAIKEGIKYIFTGLTRGQLFETRLSDMFQARIFDADEIDRTVLAARKAYHRLDDAVRQLMDVEIFERDDLFDKVQLVDFFRYTDVPLQEMYRYLDQNAPWVRPSDTGRSTNCLINDAGIYIHKKERGFHNYALPYSWDVRVGHKTRAETIDELNDDIDEKQVQRMLDEIGYDKKELMEQRAEKRLVAYYVSKKEIAADVLRKHLADRLPDYMIPNDFIHLDEFPLTVNGKVDRKALQPPDASQPREEGVYVAPTTENERKLVEVWEQVFHMSRIGVQDNFFELGGDSIISIQIVTKANQAGLQFTPRDLFEQQTISRLVLVVESKKDSLAEQGLIFGNVPLTPIQHWFFEQEFARPGIWNQTLWLDVPNTVDRNALQEAFSQLPTKHDALRTQFRVSDDGTWQQSISAEIAPLSIEYVDLSSVNAEDQKAAMHDRVSQLEGTLDLENGPLIKALLFKLGPDQPFRLVVTCHHLVVDGVSWQPLLADWEVAYHQLRQGQTPKLSARSTSYKEWSERLMAYSKTPDLADELEYWRSQSLQVDTSPGQSVSKKLGMYQSVGGMLDAYNTQAFLQKVHAAYNTNVVDLLVTAWAQAFSDLSGTDTASLMMEGHGRETEIIGDVDLSQTVGWFTTHFPVNVQLDGAWEPGSRLVQVKEQLRRIPNHGFGYGVLRYLSGDKVLAAQTPPPVLFNYLGQFELALPASDLFSLALPLQASSSPYNHRTHDLELNALIRQGRLQITLIFNTENYNAARMQSFAEDFIARLRELIEHCQSPGVGRHTPSDFALAGLNEEQFGRLSDMLDNLDESEL